MKAEKRVKVRRGEGRRGNKGRDELVEEIDVRGSQARTEKLKQRGKR